MFLCHSEARALLVEFRVDMKIAILLLQGKRCQQAREVRERRAGKGAARS